MHPIKACALIVVTPTLLDLVAAQIQTVIQAIVLACLAVQLRCGRRCWSTGSRADDWSRSRRHRHGCWCWRRAAAPAPSASPAIGLARSTPPARRAGGGALPSLTSAALGRCWGWRRRRGRRGWRRRRGRRGWRRRCRRRGWCRRLIHNKIDACEKRLWESPTACACRGMSTTIGIRLGLQEGLGLHPSKVVEVVARVSGLPNPSANCQPIRAVERGRHMPIPCIPVSPRFPRVNSRVARQESNTAIALGALQNRPIRVLEVDTACDLHPSLAAMLGGDAHLHPHVSAWSEHRDRRVRVIVPFLPDIQPLAGSRGAAATRCGPRARLRVVHELIRETIWSIISHPYSHLILAHGLHHPSVASSSRGKECQGQSN